jgi:hypothetical protein
VTDQLQRGGADGLEGALSDLATAIDWPATPALAGSVATSIRVETQPRGRWRPARRAVVLGLLAALLVVGLAAAIGFALGGLRITFGGPPPGSPLPAAVVAERGFGQAVRLDEAEAALGLLLVPTDPELGEADHVYFDSRTESVALAWGDRPGLPADRDSGLGIVVTEFRADIGPQTFEKVINSGARVEVASVSGASAYWIEGGEHYFFFRDANGQVLDASIRLVSTTLMWERDGLTVRIEGAPSLPDAVRIAESMVVR